MFNIFEQPWLLFAAAFIALIFLYISTLERKFYWLSIFILICLAVLNLVLESRFFFLSPKTLSILKIILPICAIALSALLISGIILSKDKANYIWFLPLILMTAGFGIDWVVQTDTEQIKSTLSKSELAIEHEDMALFSSVISDKYQDSMHPNKQALLQHFNSYFGQPLCDSVTNTFTQINKKQNEAEILIVVFISFNQNSFPVRDYSVSTAKVELKLKLFKEPDRKWRIRGVEIAAVDNQPFSWSAVGR
jgi:hypothetical protein